MYTNIEIESLQHIYNVYKDVIVIGSKYLRIYLLYKIKI